MSFNQPFRAVPIQLGERYRAKMRRQRIRGYAEAGFAADSGRGCGIRVATRSDTSVLRPGYDGVLADVTGRA